jgi:hypothetical protein
MNYSFRNSQAVTAELSPSRIFITIHQASVALVASWCNFAALDCGAHCTMRFMEMRATGKVAITEKRTKLAKTPGKIAGR